MISSIMMKRTAFNEPPPQLEGVIVEVGRLCSSGVRWGQLVIAHGSLLPLGKDGPKEGPLRAVVRPPEGSPRVLTEAGELRGRIRAAWRCPLLAASGRELAARGWSFVNPQQQEMAQLVVLQVGEDEDMSLDEVRGQLLRLLEEHVVEPREGQPVLLESTPFGVGNFFLNSWTKGIVNKVTGTEGCMFLCDAHAAPGSEGGGVYCVQQGQRLLVGLVVQTLLQMRGETVSLCLCASAKTVLSTALDLEVKIINNPIADSTSRGVALLRNAGSWASAVALDSEKGIFLTCAHVLNGAKNKSVQLEWLTSGGPQEAKILYKSPSSSAIDVALLKTSVRGPNFVAKMTHKPPDKGEIVEVVGYGLLAPPGPGGTLHSPLVSRGCISQSRPQMLQTSCSVHCGNSGGAVFRGPDLVGLVVGNTEITSAAKIPKNWPKINFSVPIAAIAAPIEAFLKTGDVKILKHIENFDPEATRLWTLNPVPNSKL